MSEAYRYAYCVQVLRDSSALGLMDKIKKKSSTLSIHNHLDIEGLWLSQVRSSMLLFVREQ